MNLHLSSIADSCRALALVALLVGAALPINVAAEGKDPTVTVTYPGKGWVYQGATSLNDLLVIFTIYSNEKGSPDVVAAFDLIKDLQRELWRAP